MLNLFWTDSGKNCLDLEWMINTPEGNLEEISELVKDLPKMTARHSQILKRYEPPTELPMQKTPPAKPCIKDSLRPCLKVKQCIKMGPGKLASRCLKWHVAKCQDWRAEAATMAERITTCHSNMDPNAKGRGRAYKKQQYINETSIMQNALLHEVQNQNWSLASLLKRQLKCIEAHKTKEI